MTITSFSRQASAAEMAAEIDRRGAAIESLEAQVESLQRANRHLGDQAAANRSKIAYLTSAEQRERNAWHQRDKAVRRAEEAEAIHVTLRSERDAALRAAVEAAIPLEAMTIAGTTNTLSPSIQEGIRRGIQAVRAIVAEQRT